MTLGCFEFISTFHKAGCAYWDLSISAQLREQPGDSMRRRAAWLRTSVAVEGLRQASALQKRQSFFLNPCVGVKHNASNLNLFLSTLWVCDTISVASFRSHNFFLVCDDGVAALRLSARNPNRSRPSCLLISTYWADCPGIINDSWCWHVVFEFQEIARRNIRSVQPTCALLGFREKSRSEQPSVGCGGASFPRWKLKPERSQEIFLLPWD